MNSHNYQSKVALVSILSGFVALLSIYFTIAGAGFNPAIFSDMKILLGMTNANVQMLKWSMICDMFGFYLMLVPALFYFHQYLKSKTAWSHLLTWCGASYVLIGAIGAGILATVIPALVTEYPIASAIQQEMISRNFDLVSQIVYSGMWNTVEVVLAGTWWLGLGIVLQKERPFFGTATLILGFFTLLDGFGNITGNAGMAELGLNVYLLLGIVWPIWLGLHLLVKVKKSKAVVRREAVRQETVFFPAN